jgi:hypothetical protein
MFVSPRKNQRTADNAFIRQLKLQPDNVLVFQEKIVSSENHMGHKKSLSVVEWLGK